MNVIICGAGEVGRHAAEVLAAKGHKVTVIDQDGGRITPIEESIDIRSIVGNCATADVLRQAGAAAADLVLATTSVDEVNTLAASIAKGLGAAKTIARVHHPEFFEGKDFDYAAHFSIDRLICPEYSTALAIAETLRNPGAMAIEIFARGQIEMQQMPVARTADAVGKALIDLRLPKGTRVAGIIRSEGAFIPEAKSVIQPGDSIILVGDPAHFPAARKFFHDDKTGRRRVVIMGGPPMAEWLCRVLRDRNFSIRLFETDRAHAEALAEKLDGVTVVHGDPTDRELFEDERIAEADAFVALAHDEENILGCLLAKSAGVKLPIAVVERAKYAHLLKRIGIDRSFSPRAVAVREIERVIDEGPLLRMASVAEGVIDVYRVRVGENSSVIGRPLSEIKLTPHWMLAAIQRDGQAHVPGAADDIRAGDLLMVIGKHGKEDTLRKMFHAR